MTPHSAPPARRVARTVVGVAVGVLLGATIVAAPAATANPAGTGLVIEEAYVNGGSAGATYKNRFVELFNPTNAPIDLSGLSLQYRAATGAAYAVVASLTGTVPARGHFLIAGQSNGANGADLPTPDQTTSFNGAGASGSVALASGTTAISVGDGSVVDNAAVVDLLGYGTPKNFETAPVPGGLNSVTRSLARSDDGADTDDNAGDFSATAPTPTNASGDGPAEPEPPVDRTIAEIQGTGDASPLVGKSVHTTGVVTAAYKTGGFNGFYLQTAGSGGDDDATPGASDAVFVFGSAAVARVERGDNVQVTGTVSEFDGLTEITPATASDVVVSADPAPAVKATATVFPGAAASREALEGMLIAPLGTYTVTDNFNTNQFATIGLAVGDQPLVVPTEVARPGTPARDAVAANNAARKVVLDDGASTSFVGAGRDTPVPWLSTEGTIRVGASTTFTKDVVLDYRNKAWSFQPLEQLTADDVNDVRPVGPFTGAGRPAAPDQVGGDVRLGSFNVLNYFSTTGADYTAATGVQCDYFDDRAGNPITVDSCAGDSGPRGAADAANLKRQQDKIVHAINRLGADVVSLEEIENSAKFGIDRDDALSTLVDALNADVGAGTWRFVPSPPAGELPPLDEQDVIRTAFIYRPAAIESVGPSTVLVGSPAFANAREPLAQAFKPTGAPDSETFVVIVNHFKSKGSGVDDGTGQGAANPDRVAQATALVSFANQMRTAYGTDKVFLSGDFNAYSLEDPVQVLKDAGYVDLEARYDASETYQFGGEIGSLDHVYASPAVVDQVTGLDVWNINAFESVAYEYSRFNTNVTDFYAPDPYRASDHDPVLVGIRRAQPPRSASTTRATASPGIDGIVGPIVLAKVTATPRPTGTVSVSEGGRLLATGRLGANGYAVVALGRHALSVGRHSLTVRYSGDANVEGSVTTVTVSVLPRR